MRISSRASVPAIARPRQTISAAPESRNLNALTTAFAAASNEAGARIGARTSWPSLPWRPYSTCCSANTKRPMAMKKRAQAPKSSRKGCIADGPNARPAMRLRTSGTPQASATKIAALRPASSASSRSTPNRRCNSKNGPPCEARYSPIRLASSSSASTPMATSALPMTLVMSPASSDANSRRNRVRQALIVMDGQPWLSKRRWLADVNSRVVRKVDCRPHPQPGSAADSAASSLRNSRRALMRGELASAGRQTK